ncbi:MAG: cation:proton antiporter [Candidatus Omnitrophica bacterium]|nr:cation:proton antiporter [Candidatus Omnitrophota bacterium]
MNVILGVSLIFLFGLVASRFAGRIKTPAITGYLIIGIILGPYVLNFVPKSVIDVSGLISNLALSFIAFSLGQNFSRSVFQQVGRQVMWISILAALGACLFVFVGMLVLKLAFYTSLLFGVIAAATAPAALIMVVRQYKAKGRFTEILMGVVAIDDAWGLIAFSLGLAFARAIYFNQTSNIMQIILKSLLEIAGSFVLGVVLGAMFNLFGKYMKTQRDLLVYTLGMLMLTCGLALHFHFSVLLSCMFLSAVVINSRRENFRFFEALQNIDWPIYLLFFVLAGANLEVDLLKDIGLIGLVYVVTRMIGKYIGTYFGAVISKADSDVKKYLALAQMPQAGVALGMALIAKSSFPQVGGMIFTTIAATTIVYEIIGPYFVRVALEKAGQIPAASAAAEQVMEEVQA